jgi:hypothetical protein
MTMMSRRVILAHRWCLLDTGSIVLFSASYAYLYSCPYSDDTTSLPLDV